jgi:ADP-ribosylglycohydrolase
MNAKEKKRVRLQNALWGLFIGDALAMPAHWYYNPDNIRADFNGGIRGYEAPPHPHPESFMVGMGYHPDVKTAKRIRRPYDILHDHARFYNTSYSKLEIRSTEREGEHGNATPRLAERYHYHHGLATGENTLGAHLVRVLLRSVVEAGRYDPDAFLNGFIAHLITPDKNRDPYTEIYIRCWFENYARGLPPRVCAAFQRDVWSIGSHGGVIRPLLVSLLAESAYQGLGMAVEHQNLTHRSENNVGALGVLVPLLNDLLGGADPQTAAASHAKRVHAPRVSGKDLFAAYRDHNGPGHIPTEKMWRLHTELLQEPLNVDDLVQKQSEAQVIRQLFASACYPEHGLPLLLYLAQKHAFEVESALLANTNAGGDNVHRGMILGLVVGAANDSLPENLMTGLVAYGKLKAEIEGFAEIALRGNGI